jgi:SAM-dependent methyltransferase
MPFDAFVTAERDGWHARAEGYADHTALATLQIVPTMLDMLRATPGMRLLDVGCGPGHVAGAAAALELNAEGIDYAPGMIAAARKRFPNLTFTVGDAEDLPCNDAAFDAVACNMGLFHMGDPNRAMVEAARVLHSGGRFVFSQWTAPDDSPIYSRLFAALGEIADMTRADPAPNAYALSNQSGAITALQDVGFTDIEVRRLDTRLIATGDDFFDFFMRFGVRVPLIVDAQDPDVRARLKHRINNDLEPFRTSTGFEISMPSLVYSGTKK